jgi:hypothetical protein
MRENGYKIDHIQNFCSICPDEYWKQLHESYQNRYNSKQQRR